VERTLTGHRARKGGGHYAGSGSLREHVAQRAGVDGIAFFSDLGLFSIVR